MIFFNQNSWIFETTPPIMPHHVEIIIIVTMFSTPKMIRKKEDIQHLYYICDINNLDSILENGIASRNCAIKNKWYQPAHDISNAEVQALRERKILSPYDKKSHNLHDYANFYIQERNSLLHAVAQKKSLSTLCVIKVSPKILNIPGAILTLGNAACASSSFFTPLTWTVPSAYVEAFNHSHFSGSHSFLDKPLFEKNKQLRQSEALILDHVHARYIEEVVVYDSNALMTILTILEENNLIEAIKASADPAFFPGPPALFSTPPTPKRKEPSSGFITPENKPSAYSSLNYFTPKKKKLDNDGISTPLSLYQVLDGSRSLHK